MGFPADPSFAALLRRYRLAAGVSQEQLAQRAGLSANAVGELERGMRRAPYRATVQALAAALGLSPEEATTFDLSVDRHRSLIRRRERSAAFPSTQQFTAALPPMIGRQEARRELSQILVRHDVRLVTVAGPGGVGKTRLALSVFDEVRGSFPDGIWFVDLSAVSSEALVLPTIADALGLSDPGMGTALEQIAERLHRCRTLIVLDNFEQVIDAAPILQHLLSRCANLTLLVTSREALRLRSEHVLALEPLACPDPSYMPQPSEMALIPAIALLLERAAAGGVPIVVSEENAPVVAALCRALDGLPLAIELAAGHLSILSPAEILQRLQDRLPLTQTDARDLSPRHQTVDAAIGWSYDLLSEPEQRLLRYIGVFSGGFTLEAAEAVAGAAGLAESEVLGALASLVGKSLVTSREDAEGESRRFRVMESIRRFALEKLSDQENMRRAHAAYYMEFAERAAPQLLGPAQRLWLGRLDDEVENLRAAAGYLSERGEGEMELRLVTALGHYAWNRALVLEERTRLEEALARAPDAPAALRAKALALLGDLLISQDQGGLAEAVLNDALKIAEAEGEHLIVAQSLAHLGRLATHSRDWQAAEGFFQRALVEAGQTGDRWWTGYCQLQLGGLAFMQGERERADTSLQMALAAFREIDDWQSAIVLN